jgi:hypothetical protein
LLAVLIRAFGERGLMHNTEVSGASTVGT